MLKPKKLSSGRIRTAAAGSWVALVAATTLGDAAVDAVRAEVRADGLSGEGTYRLVVQSYDSGQGERPGRYERPVGSVQRAVTAEELRAGVHVSLMEFRESLPKNGSGATVLAWIESGEPNLEFDGRTARPRPGSVYGTVKRDLGREVVQVSLTRKMTA